MSSTPDRFRYPELLSEVKQRIRIAQTKAIFAANKELLSLYWDIGRLLTKRQVESGWGSRVYRRLSADIKNELSEVKGFSERNLKLMAQFFREYPDFPALGQQPVALIGSENDPRKSLISQENLGQQLVAQLPWGHNVLLLQKVKDASIRHWYMAQTVAEGWSRAVLQAKIDSDAHRRQGKSITNFKAHLPAAQSDLAQQTLKDPYIFDFLTIEEPFHERELEVGLMDHVQKFLLELGQGFAFVGRQFHVDLGGEDFYIDLLFYHLQLRSFIVIELKKGKFKPEYAGKLNFYLSVVDKHLRQETDNPSIGLILCQEKNKIIAEYALQSIQRPIGVSEYKITRALPKELQSSLPTIEAIEREFANDAKRSGSAERRKVKHRVVKQKLRKRAKAAAKTAAKQRSAKVAQTKSAKVKVKKSKKK